MFELIALGIIGYFAIKSLSAGPSAAPSPAPSPAPAPAPSPPAPAPAPAVSTKKTVLTPGQKVVMAVKKAIDAGVKGAHCWDWAWLVYNMAGFGGGSKHSVSKIQFIFRGNQYIKGKYKFLPQYRYIELTPGDWLYIHNKNRFDKNGNHSVIFLGWEDKDKFFAKTASCPGPDSKGNYRPGHYETRNLKDQPVTWLQRPKV